MHSQSDQSNWVVSQGKVVWPKQPQCAYPMWRHLLRFRTTWKRDFHVWASDCYPANIWSCALFIRRFTYETVKVSRRDLVPGSSSRIKHEWWESQQHLRCDWPVLLKDEWFRPSLWELWLCYQDQPSSSRYTQTPILVLLWSSPVWEGAFRFVCSAAWRPWWYRDYL